MTQEEAVRARNGMHGKMLGGMPLKINFGKDTGPPQERHDRGGYSGSGANMTPLHARQQQQQQQQQPPQQEAPPPVPPPPYAPPPESKCLFYTFIF